MCISGTPADGSQRVKSVGDMGMAVLTGYNSS